MITLILNHAPYGNEKSYNALRLSLSVIKRKATVQLFLLDDGVFNAVKNQNTPTGYYNIERLIRSLVRRGYEVHA
jgi:uncharacterized protein involved in oxidation of intracellular sulfur